MDIEQNTMQFALPANQTGYIDLARCLSALNARSIEQTKRSDGKYKPLNFLVRIRSFNGSLAYQTLNAGYPTRNSIVLAGKARDEMLKSAGVSRSNLESYQKELRIMFDEDMKDANSLSPGATTLGFGPDFATQPSHSNAYGNFTQYDYTQLVYDDPASPGTDKVQKLCVIGTSTASAAGFIPTVFNWYRWRHSFTPSSANDDIQDNVFSYVMQQSSTADKIIDVIDDEADEKPYSLGNFMSRTIQGVVSTSVGNPQSNVMSAPLGLIKITSGTDTTNSFEVEVVGVTEL